MYFFYVLFISKFEIFYFSVCILWYFVWFLLYCWIFCSCRFELDFGVEWDDSLVVGGRNLGFESWEGRYLGIIVFCK